MVKDPRNPKRWENTEIQSDPEAYVQSQQAYREDQEAAVQQQRDADDERAWIEGYVHNGGRERDAAAAYKAFRNQQAAEAAGRAEEAALLENRSRVRQTL